MRPVYLQAYAALLPAEAGGAVPGFDPVDAGIPRKSLKTMTRAVQLGVACVRQALEGYPAWASIPPERRGLFVGASPQQGEASDLAPALQATGPVPDLLAFAERGVPLVPPLWLVKGLSNNVLGYASANHDLRGDNGNWCDGRLGGAVAVAAAIHAVAEARCDIAIGGGADALRGAEPMLGRPCGEGAVFFVFSAVPGPWLATAGVPGEQGAASHLGELGAVAVPASLALGLPGDVAAGGVRFRPVGH
ncbi:MAG: hypothetical protein FJ090_02960 [Deltaproteobacteria bacterium]|nr:hypothetical protein [Deltaproteobacteria bacterium]